MNLLDLTSAQLISIFGVASATGVAVAYTFIGDPANATSRLWVRASGLALAAFLLAGALLIGVVTAAGRMWGATVSYSVATGALVLAVGWIAYCEERRCGAFILRRMLIRVLLYLGPGALVGLLYALWRSS